MELRAEGRVGREIGEGREGGGWRCGGERLLLRWIEVG
jgi:hypothetical protein